MRVLIADHHRIVRKGMSISIKELIRAIRTVAADKIYLSPQITEFPSWTT